MKRYWMIIVICFLVLTALGTCHNDTWQRTPQTVTLNPSPAIEPSPSASVTLVQNRSATPKPIITSYPTRKV